MLPNKEPQVIPEFYGWNLRINPEKKKNVPKYVQFLTYDPNLSRTTIQTGVPCFVVIGIVNI